IFREVLTFAVRFPALSQRQTPTFWLSGFAHHRSGEQTRVLFWTRNFTLLEAATAVSARFISSRRSRRIKCATTRCISSLDLSMRHAEPYRVFRTRHGNSGDGILSIVRRFTVKLKAEFQGSNREM